MASTISSGKDGIIRIGPSKEVPCLIEWTLNGTPSNQANSPQCMQSNGDQTSITWDAPEVQSKGWTLDARFYWQTNPGPTGASGPGAAQELDITNVGALATVKLIPTGNEGDIHYEGTAYLGTVETVGNTSEKITQRATFIGSGALSIL